MKKFIKRVVVFLLPILCLHLVLLFYNYNKGDLVRMGKLIDFYPDYRDKFVEDLEGEIYYSSYSDSLQKTNYKFMTIGDSFSEQFAYGYKNYIAKKEDVLHIDRFLFSNQLQTLSSLIKGDFFDTYKFDYVILQCIERDFVRLVGKVNLQKKMNISDLDSLLDKHKFNKPDHSYKFPSKRVFSVAINSLNYKFRGSQILEGKIIHNQLITDTLFSNRTKDFLFYHRDVTSIKYNNDSERVFRLNTFLNNIGNQLQSKGIKLIVLPSPDKYDMYYNYIEETQNLEKPIFFDLLAKEEKKYIYIDAKKILENKMKNFSDIYFYDDTHWSPIASKIVANEILEVTKVNK